MLPCAVATCRNTHHNTKGKGIIFHQFPQKNEKLLMNGYEDAKVKM